MMDDMDDTHRRLIYFFVMFALAYTLAALRMYG
jgi:hypothetical protein